MNGEIIQYKISLPLINDKELLTIDNYYNEIVDEFVKESVKEKDDIITQRIMMNLRKENQQLKTEKEQLNSLVNSCQEEIRRLKRELQALKVSEEEWLEKSDK